jgi:hypothetical protein
LLQQKKAGQFFYHSFTSTELVGEQDQQFSCCEPTHFTVFYSRCVVIYSAFIELSFEFLVVVKCNFFNVKMLKHCGYPCNESRIRNIYLYIKCLWTKHLIYIVAEKTNILSCFSFKLAKPFKRLIM